MENELTFNEAIKRLEVIVNELENGKCELEDSVKLFEEGTKLSKYCYSVIDNAKIKIENLIEKEVEPKE